MQQSLRDEFLTFRTATATGIRTSSLPPEFFLLLTDSLECPATFLLTHFIAKSIREGRRTILIGSGNPQDHYSSILKKASIQLSNTREKDLFTFISAIPSSPNFLQSLTLSLQSALQQPGTGIGPLILFDDISSFLWSGISVSDITRFISGIRIAVVEEQRKGSLVVLQHGDELGTPDSPSDDYTLFRRLYQRSDLWLELSNLSSQTHGELSIHRGAALVNDYGVMDRSGPTALQYKLEDSGPIFSVKGLGQGFL